MESGKVETEAESIPVFNSVKINGNFNEDRATL